MNKSLLVQAKDSCDTPQMYIDVYPRTYRSKKGITFKGIIISEPKFNNIERPSLKDEL